MSSSDMQTFHALLALCVGNPLVISGFPSQRASNKKNFDVFFVVNSGVVSDLRCCHTHAMYRQVSNISRTLVGNKIVDHSDVVGASPVGAAPTTSSFST